MIQRLNSVRIGDKRARECTSLALPLSRRRLLIMARFSWILSVLLLSLFLLPGSLSAQFGGGLGGIGGGGLGGLGGGLGNNGGLGGVGGVLIDPQGMVSLKQERPVSPAALKKQLNQFAQNKLPAGMIVETPDRVLSLKNLEALVASHLEKKTDLPLELLCLAGMQRIDAVIFDSERKDVYLTGPAEPFGPDGQGRMIGLNSHRPPLLLEDLLTALRSVQQNDMTIGCSIDPTPDNMQSLQNYLRQNSTPATAAQVQQRFRVMASVLGNQEISVWGVPTDSHFAVALVEADIRMKRISLGVDSAGVPGIRSHLSMLRPQGNSLQRWWFVPMYEPLETNAEQTLFRLKGQRAKLLAQEEISDASGRRADANTTRQSTEKFAQLFTENFQSLADKSSAFAELQSLYDLAVVAALIRSAGPRHLGADPFPVLTSAEKLPLPVYAVPKSLPSTSTFRSAGTGTILGLVGGVTMDLGPVLAAPRVAATDDLAAYRRSLGDHELFSNGLKK